MANINEILARAAALRDETALNSISPERAGGIMYDTLLAMNELWLQQGAALVISKIYASVAAMEADTAPVSDLTGKPLRPGQIVVIASSDSDNGSVYRYNATDSPSWSLVGNIGNLEPVDSLDSDSTQLPLAAHQGKVLDGKISQLGQQVIYKINAETFNNGNPSYSGWTGNKNDVLLTKDDVSINTGDYIRVIVQQGQMVACNSSDTILKYFGVGTTDWASVSSDFAYFKSNLNGTILASIQNQTILSNKALNEKINKLPAIIAGGRIIGYDTTSLADANNAVDNKLYLIRTGSLVPQNYHPQTKIYTSIDYEYLLTTFYTYYNNNKSGYGYQYAFNNAMDSIWLRTYTQDANGVKTFYNWVLSKPLTIEVGSDKYFTTIRSACEFAWTNSNHEHPITIHVNSGTYDLIEEWGEELTESTAGIYIGKSMKLIFDEDAELTCNYEGNNATIATVFSGFMSGSGSFEIDGMKISASNIRYCVHDEVGGESADDVKHIFRNCRMYLDNSNSPSSLGTTACIGGGLGRFTNILVENCVFDSECQDNEPVASYHMTTHFNDAQCHVVIKDNYCKRGTIRGGYAGQTPATLKSPFLINGNSVKSAPFVFQETSGAAENIDFMAWNNEIRS